MNSKKNILYSFGDYLVEVGERRLWNKDNLIPLTPKAFETLLVLLEHKGRVLDKDFLLSRIWTDTFVEEVTLAKNISTLRKALGLLTNGQQFIETVSGKGYRFIADVKEIIREEDFAAAEPPAGTAQITAEQEKILKSISEIKVDSGNQAELWKSGLLQKDFIPWIKRNKRPAAIVFTCCLVFGLIILGLRFLSSSSSAFSATNFKEIELSTLTSDGSINRVAISPDGKYLAMVKRNNQKRSLMVRQLDNSATIEILPPQDERFRGLTFSPDGKQIYYVTFRPKPDSNYLIGSLYKIAMLGGTPQLVTTNVDSPVTISPDGREFAFIRNYPEEQESSLMVGSFEAAEEPKKLAVRNIQSGFSVTGAAWSPDGKIIVCGAKNDEKTSAVQTIAVNAQTGEQRLLTETKWQWMGQPAWLADGSGMIFSAVNPQSSNQTEDVWLLSYPQGEIRQITNGLNSILGLSLTADGKTIVMVKTSRLTNLSIASAQSLNESICISKNMSEFNLTIPGISWTKDGRLLFASTLNGNMDIWKMNADGTDKRQITSNEGTDFAPVATPDGHYIIFVSYRSGKPNLWRIKPDGSGSKQLTDETGVSSPSVAPDGRTIYYSAMDAKISRPFLHKIDIEGGAPEQITSLPVISPQISPDGKLIACYFPELSDNKKINDSTFKLTILSAQNGQLIRQFENILNLSNPGIIKWSTGKSLTYTTTEDEISKLWEQSIENEKPKLLMESATDTIFGFAWWIEGQKLAYEKTATINDIVLINSKNTEKR